MWSGAFCSYRAPEGAHEEDALLVASLQRALGSTCWVRYPKMVNEDNPAYAALAERFLSLEHE